MHDKDPDFEDAFDFVAQVFRDRGFENLRDDAERRSLSQVLAREWPPERRNRRTYLFGQALGTWGAGSPHNTHTMVIIGGIPVYRQALPGTGTGTKRPKCQGAG